MRPLAALALVLVIGLVPDARGQLAQESAHAVPDFGRAPSAARLRAVLAAADPHFAPLRVARERVAAAPFTGAPVTSGMNVRVNDPALDTPERTTQNETTLAVLGSTVCAAYNNGSGSPNALSGFARSEDGGVTWTDEGLTGPLQLGDPALAVHKRSGSFYYADLSFMGDRSPSGSLRSAIGVARSTDGCATFPTLANASPGIGPPAVCSSPDTRQCLPCSRNADCDSRAGAGNGVCTGADEQDKPWITVDNTGGPRDGYVYVCWTRFVDEFQGAGTGAEIRFSRSTDGGVSFDDDQAISTALDSFPIGCHLDVGPRGEVYIAWADRSQGVDSPIIVRRSADGGITWDSAVQVNSLPIRPPGTDRVAACGTSKRCGMPAPVTVHEATLNGDVRMIPQAWPAVDATGGPFNGNLYVVWASDPPGPIDNSDVFFSRSSDGGRTWSPAAQIAGGSVADQFEPFVAVGGAGTVSIAWYDRRNDPANFLIDVYTTFSRDGGVTFEPITRVTDVSFGVPLLTGQPTPQGNFDPSASACYMGEYIAVTADADSFYYAWGDNRDIVISTAYPRGRLDPDVFFDRLPVPPVLCGGDCDGSGAVTIDELLMLVNIALGNALPSACTAGDANHDGLISVDELLAAVNDALNSCPHP